MYSYGSIRAESVGCCVAILWINECKTLVQFLIFHSGRVTCVLVMIARLGQKQIIMPNWEMVPDFQKYALYVSIVIVHHFDGLVLCEFNP